MLFHDEITGVQFFDKKVSKKMVTKNLSEEPDYKLVFESSPDLYIILDKDLTILAISDAHLKASLTERSRVTGQNVFDVFPDNPNEAGATGASNLRQSLEYVLKTKKTHSMPFQKYDIRNEGGDFEERYWLVVNSPVFGSNGEMIYILNHAEDVTEFVKLQQEGDEQIKINENLRNIVAERKQALVEKERLVERLTKSNEDLERFAYTASHDLRSPLRAIDSLSRMLEEDLGDALGDSKKHVDTLRQRVKRMEKLLDDILAYARIDHTLEKNAGEFVNGKILVQEISGMLGPPASLKIFTGKTLADIDVPRIPVQQVLHNLIDNAIKHHDKGEGSIVIDVEEKEDQYIVSVRDDGPGISPEYHQKIFEMFQTLKSRDKVEGSGMGLAFVKKVLSFYDSAITVESAPGQGTIFRFSWPKTSADTTEKYAAKKAQQRQS